MFGFTLVGVWKLTDGSSDLSTYWRLSQVLHVPFGSIGSYTLEPASTPGDGPPEGAPPCGAKDGADEDGGGAEEGGGMTDVSGVTGAATTGALFMGGADTGGGAGLLFMIVSQSRKGLGKSIL